jgi:molybdopterin synthase catalytic subunit
VTANAEVDIRNADFSVEAEYRELLARAPDCGACVVFTGLVRAAAGEGRRIEAMELEHYPGMTESRIAEIIATARGRWQLDAVRVIHRIGRLLPGDQIVLAGVASRHRGDAFAACEFIMDYLKTRAPLWKKEIGADGESWVEARDRDAAAAARWHDAASEKA